MEAVGGDNTHSIPAFRSNSEVSTIINMRIEERLYDAAKEGDIDSLYTLIQEDPHVLERIDEIPFVQTPLHVAAAVGNLQFAEEIMELKPSFALKRNQQGFRPIHLAMQENQKNMVLCFVKINKDLVRVKAKKGITPLHFVSETGDVDLLGEFLTICPDSIKDVTVRRETALHIAAKNDRFEALKYLINWLETNENKDAMDLEKDILNRKDEEGNTILHISILNNDLKALARLLKTKVDLKAKNLEGKSALDLESSPEIKSLLNTKAKGISSWNALVDKLKNVTDKSRFRTLFKRGLNMSDEARSDYLVVFALIATATYQAALSPPGGLYQASAGTRNTLSHLNTNESSMNWKPNMGIGGNSIMSNSDFLLFSVANMFSFLTSTFALIFLLANKKLLWWSLLSGPTMYLQLSYLLAMMVISPTRFTTTFLFLFYATFTVPGYLLYISSK